MQSKCVFILAVLLFPFIVASQNNPETIEGELGESIVVKEIVSNPPIDALSPSKAAFYSAILPGLGQAYNKKYWKIPIIYGGLATGIYFYLDNNREYNRYRDAYKNRLAGFTDDEFYGSGSTPKISNDALIRAQKTLRKNKEISLLVTIGIYALNIIDANVDAHLLQYNIDKNLALRPHYKINEMEATSNLGLTLDFSF